MKGRRVPLRSGQRMSPLIGAAPSPIARASAQDRNYFAQCPGEPFYYRPYVAGEFGPNFPPAGLPPGEIIVEVEQLAPGMRRRRPAFVAIELSREG